MLPAGLRRSRISCKISEGSGEENTVLLRKVLCPLGRAIIAERSAGESSPTAKIFSPSGKANIARTLAGVTRTAENPISYTELGLIETRNGVASKA